MVDALLNGRFTSACQVLASVVRAGSSQREIGQPELARFLMQLPFVEYLGVYFVDVSGNLYGGTLGIGRRDDPDESADREGGQGGGEGDEGGLAPAVAQRAWKAYATRVTLSGETFQPELSTWDPHILEDLCADSFMRDFYVDGTGKVKKRVPKIGKVLVLRWPPFWGFQEPNPESLTDYYRFAKAMLIRFLPWRAGAPADVLSALADAVASMRDGATAELLASAPPATVIPTVTRGATAFAAPVGGGNGDGDDAGDVTDGEQESPPAPQTGEPLPFDPRNERDERVRKAFVSLYKEALHFSARFREKVLPQVVTYKDQEAMLEEAKRRRAAERDAGRPAQPSRNRRDGGGNDDMPVHAAEDREGDVDPHFGDGGRDASAANAGLPGDRMDDVVNVAPRGQVATTLRECVPACLAQLTDSSLSRVAWSASAYASNLAPRASGWFDSSAHCKPLTPEQEVAVNMAMHDVDKGGALLVVGGPGVGKSNVIHHLVAAFAQRGNPGGILVTATTGKAAYSVGGVTAHSAFMLHLGKTKKDPNQQVPAPKVNALRQSLARVQLVVVEECSMFGCLLVDKLNDHLRLARQASDPRRQAMFGGFRVVFVGDFAQCPPVHSGAPLHKWTGFPAFEVVRLLQVHRQRDPHFLDCLAAIRTRSMTPEHAEKLRSLFALSRHPQRAADFDADPRALHLVSTNVAVDEVNDAFLASLFAQRPSLRAICAPQHQGSKVLHLVHGVRYIITQNVAATYGLANGVAGELVGVLYMLPVPPVAGAGGAGPGEEAPGIPSGPAALAAYLKAPDVALLRMDDVDADLRWAEGPLRELLDREEVGPNGEQPIYVRVDDGGQRRPLLAERDAIVSALRGVVPIPRMERINMDGDEGILSRGGRRRGRVSRMALPLRVLRGVTVHRVQGQSLSKMILCLGYSFSKV